MTARLVCRLGFDDYDVTGHAEVHRICVGRNMRRRDVFNVYCRGGVKRGAPWRGSVASSLRAALLVAYVRIVVGPAGATHASEDGVFFARRALHGVAVWHRYCPTTGWVREAALRFPERLTLLPQGPRSVR